MVRLEGAMRRVRLGNVLLIGGLAVGAVAALGYLLGFDPMRLPPALVRIAVYKLTFLAALGLIAAGAVVRRHTRRAESSEREEARPASDSR
jgi:hypothetical protein